MKSALIMLILFLLTASAGFAQQGLYQPIPSVNVNWKENAFSTAWLPAPTPIYDDYMLFVSGDSLIGSYAYYTNQYIGAFRQDSGLRKVFIIAASDSVEQLLYDFSLSAGDTLAPSYNNNFNNPNTSGNYVIAVDSVFVGATLHRRLLLSPIFGGFSFPDTNYAIIEGVGSTIGFYHFIEPPFETGSQLLCFSHDSTNYPAGAFCPFYLGQEESMKPENSLSIFPNPCKDKATIRLNENLNNAQLVLTNIIGDVVEVKAELKGKSVLIEKGKKCSGIYFITLREETRIIGKGKIIFFD